MARKYTPPKKKKNRSPVAATVRATASQAAPAAVATQQFSIAHPPAAKAAAIPVPASTAKYENLPRELRRVAVLTVITITLLLILWLILR